MLSLLAFALSTASPNPSPNGQVRCQPDLPSLDAAARPRPIEVRFNANDFNGAWDTSVAIGSFSFWKELTINGEQALLTTAIGKTTVQTTLQGRVAKMALPEGQFVGELSKDGRLIEGMVTSPGGTTTPVRFRRHSQTPVGAQPYHIEDVNIRSADGTMLSGTLTIPVQSKPAPAVVLAVGSLPADRDYVGFASDPSHRAYAVLADELTRHGIAVLRFDQRGIGRSSGTLKDTTEVQIEQDLAAGIAYLATRPEIAQKQIGIIGHSAGGVRATRLMKTDTQLSFAVLIASTGAPLIDFVDTQADSRTGEAGAMGLSPAGAEITKRLARAVISAKDTAEAQKDAAAELKVIRGEGAPASPFAGLNDLNVIALTASEPYRFLLSYDPAPDLASLTKPVLAILPMEDGFVDPKQNLPLMQAALGHDTLAEVCSMPGLDHTLRPTARTMRSEDVDETIDPSLLAVIDSWIESVTRNAAVN